MNHLRIKELLGDKKSKDFAKELDITENGLSLIINGKRQPRFEQLELIAKKLNVEMWQLFAGAGSVTNGSGSGLNGFVEFNGTIHRIQSLPDLEKLLEEVKKG